MKFSSSIRVVDEQEVIAVLSKWWIMVAVMLSLLMQLLLLLTGDTRKWNRASRFVAWNAYNWSDYIATTALGGLAQAAAVAHDADRKEIYALWAPILLLHLGAPDNISAYAKADAELWKRHGLTMLLQVAIVVYVVANCARSWKFVLLSVCLTVLGSVKYAERTFALKRATHGDMTESVLPIYKYMIFCSSDMALGTKGALISPDSVTEEDAELEKAARRSKFYYIINEEEQWLANFERLVRQPSIQSESSHIAESVVGAARETPGLVTVEDIFSSNELRQQTPSVVWLCVAFSLFKLYRRRLCRLYMFEWRSLEIREFFLEDKILFSNTEKLLFVLDAELRFIFDSIYTKAAGTAFTRTGVGFRFLNTILLVVSVIFILGGKLDLRDVEAYNYEEQHIARDVTFCLIVAALVVEVYQLSRLGLSDRFRVWLACRYILVREKLRQKRSRTVAAAGRHSFIDYGCDFLQINTDAWRAALLLRVLKVLVCTRMLGFYGVSSIGQYAFTNTEGLHLRAPLAHVISIEPPRRTSWQKIKAMLARLMLTWLPVYEQNKEVVRRFKIYVMSRVVEACKKHYDQQKDVDDRIVSAQWCLPSDIHNDIVGLAFGTSMSMTHKQFPDFEDAVIVWHVVTCMCEERYNHLTSATQAHDWLYHAAADEDMRMSRLLSRYLMYLMVHKTKLLPCGHADSARQLVADTQRNISDPQYAVPPSIAQYIKHIDTPNLHQRPKLHFPRLKKAIDELHAKLAPVERWRLISNVWVHILMYAATCDKPHDHLLQLTQGGEFFTHIWMFLGHLGYGVQYQDP
ncbi:hypothetical protein L7F22_037903 [Adiantum nelumboides]|nr:hypothetical protein [Adiantum nelumboides]